MRVQNRIKQYIEKNGLKIRFVAEISNIPEKRFYRIMNNSVKLTADEFEKICVGLQIEPTFFLNEASE